MKIAGANRLAAPRERVWEALHDPEVLRVAIPGLERLEVQGRSEFALTMRVGVGPITGSYAGTLSIADVSAGSACTLRAVASGAQGSVAADVDVRLRDCEDGGTDVAFDAEAIVTGPVAAVGQRLIGAVARRLTSQFFTGVDDVLAGAVPAQPTAVAPVVAAPAATPPGRPGMSPRGGFRLDGWSVLAGFVLALAAMLIGHFL